VINRKVANLTKVSVIIPTYNRAHTVGRSIESALCQTHRDLEILVVDDGSTDQTLDAVKPFLRYPQVRYLRHKRNKGHQAARNTGIRNSCGDYIAFLDSDDTWMPQKTVLQLDAINKIGATCVAITGMWVITEGGSKTKYIKKYDGYVYPEMLAAHGPNFCCLLVPMECLRQIGFLDEKIKAFADWDMCISLSKCCKFATVDEPCTLHYANEPDSVTRNLPQKAHAYERIVYKNQKDMLQFIGRRGLALHHRNIAHIFDSAGEFSRSKAHIIKAFKIDSKSPTIFMLAFSALFGERVYHFVELVGLIMHIRSSSQVAPA
jgi:glycosyltransferase involved in cell wall biosynthesis